LGREDSVSELGNHLLTCKFCGEKVNQINFYKHLTKKTHEFVPGNFIRMETFRFFEPLLVEISKNKNEIISLNPSKILKIVKKLAKNLKI
jgi:hypothetical protein